MHLTSSASNTVSRLQTCLIFNGSLKALNAAVAVWNNPNPGTMTGNSASLLNPAEKYLV
jgi:hypothetical protein